MRFIRTYAISIFCTIVCTEIVQLILQVGSFDVDDIILNFFGAIIIYVIVINENVFSALKKIYIAD